MWLSDLQIVLPDGVLERGSLRIEQGCIADIVEGPVQGTAVHGAGLLAIPGPAPARSCLLPWRSTS